MDVTIHNFELVLPKLQAALHDCDYVAIDAEMTGLHLANSRKDEVFDSVDDRYWRLRQSAQNFLIMQFGMSTFKWNPEKQAYTAATFNFYVFPQPYERSDLRFTCQASSISFLRSHKFDFNKFVYEGIPYLPLDKMAQQESRQNGSLLPPLPLKRDSRAPIVLRRTEDIDFVEAQMKKVREWLEAAEEEEGAEKDENGTGSTGLALVLDAANSFRRAALYQELERLFGKEKFVAERIQVGSDFALQLTATTAGSAAEREAQAEAARQRSFQEASGFGRAVAALVSAGKPLIGHNCLFDLAFFCQQFVGPLPPTFQGFREQLTALFPAGIYDTKHLARQLAQVFDSSGTSLETVFKKVTLSSSMAGELDRDSSGAGSEGPGQLLQNGLPLLAGDVPKIEHEVGFDRYCDLGEGASMAHEAGYDAFMTGAAFAGLSHLLHAEAEEGREGEKEDDAAKSAGQAVKPYFSAVQPHKNRINIMFSDLQYLPLEGPIPVPDRSHVFLLSNFGQETTTSSLVDLLESLGLGSVRVTWVDQQSAFISLLDKEKAGSVVESLTNSIEWQGTCTPFAQLLTKVSGKEADTRPKKSARTRLEDFDLKQSVAETSEVEATEQDYSTDARRKSCVIM